MPITTKKIIIELSGSGGLVSKYHERPFDGASHPELSMSGNDNQYADGVVNPLTKFGYLSPANNTIVSVSSAGTKMIGSTIADTVNSKGYFWERGTKLYEIDSFTDTTVDTNRTVTGAIGTDLEIYAINGVRHLFYAYQKSGGGNIGSWDFAATYDDDWLSAAASGGFNTGATTNTKMIVADNGYMFVLDGSALHKVDGTTAGGANGTVTANVLLWPAYYQLVDGIDLRGNLWIALVKTTTNVIPGGAVYASVPMKMCGVYVWDRQSTRVNIEDFISIDGVTAIRCMFILKGVPGCFTVSSEGNTQIRIFNGNEFKVEKELGLEAYPRFPDSVHNEGNRITWQGNDGIIYSYGEIEINYPNILHKIGNMRGHIDTDDTFDVAGALLGVSTTNARVIFYTTYYSHEGGTTKHYITQWYPYYQVGKYALSSQFYSLVRALPKLSKLKSITIFWPPTGDSGTNLMLKVDIFLNQNTASWGSVILSQTDGAIGYKYIPIGESNVNFVQIGLNYYVQLMTKAITPIYAEVEYEITTKKK